MNHLVESSITSLPADRLRPLRYALRVPQLLAHAIIAVPLSLLALNPLAARVRIGATTFEKASAAETYDREITRLRTIVDQRRGTLDSTTVAVLEKNLRIIDDAILQCRRALESDPSSTYLNDSLNEALDNKVQLLRAAATLQTTL